MNQKKYPRVGSKSKRGNRKGPCKICKTATVGRVDIQVNYMRGDDDVWRVCEACQKDDAAILAKYNDAVQAATNRAKA